MGSATGRSGLLLVALAAALTVAFLITRPQRRETPGGTAVRASAPAEGSAAPALLPAHRAEEGPAPVATGVPVSREAAAPVPSAAIPEPEPARTPLRPGEAVLQVRVRADDDVLAAGVQVALFTEDELYLPRRTSTDSRGALDEVLSSDERGRVEIRVAAGRSYRLRARRSGAPDWPPAFKTTPVLAPGDYRLVIVRLGEPRPGRPVRVVDERSREPIADARVLERSGSAGVVLRELPVGGDGVVVVPELEHTLSFEAPGYASASWSGTRWSEAARDEVALARVGALEVEVVSPGGEAVADRRVTLKMATDGLQRNAEASRRTDEHGTCVYEELSPHVAFTIEVSRSGAVPLTVHDAEGLRYGERRRLMVPIRPGATVGGTVLGPDGRPLEDAVVSLWPGEEAVGEWGARSSSALERTGPDGRFRFAGLSPGSWSLGSGLVRGKTALRTRTFLVVEDEFLEMDLVGWRDLAIRGRIDRSAEEALERSARVLVQAETRGHAETTLMTGDTFVIEPLIDAPYRLRLVDGERVLAELADIRPGGEPLRIVVDE